MQGLFSNLRYAVRQFRQSPVFTVAAVLTLALGIGGTTAIFTLIHAVMLRSLPVSDPGRLYRIGEGDECCVEGGPQDVWGFYSFPLYERLKAAAPEFEELAAFQAGNWIESVRRQGELAPRPLHAEYVTGNYFSMLGVGAFGGRVFTPDDDRPAAPPVAVLSHRAWQTTYGGDPTVVGSTFVVEGHPFTVIGVAPPGFFGETLRSDPPDIWIPVQQEPMITGQGALLPQSAGAWLRVMGRLRPGASIDGMSARLTGVLRQWLQYDSGYPANWMPDVIRMLPKQVINVIPAGAGVAQMKEEYGRSLRDPARGLRPGAVDCVRQRCELTPGSSRSTSWANCNTPGHWGHASADYRAGSRGKRSPRDRWRRCRAAGGRGGRARAVDACLPERTLPSHQPYAIARRVDVRLRIGPGDRSHLRRSSCVVCYSHRSH